MKPMVIVKIHLLALVLIFLPRTVEGQNKPIPNKYIDANGYMEDTVKALKLRENRRITEIQFLQYAKEKNTIILDTRSKEKFNQRHIKGSVNLPFSEITIAKLKKVIPSKKTRVLIYCNNNIEGEPVYFPTKSIRAPLNLPTFQTLYSYGYLNIYELGPVVDPKKSKIEFTGETL